MEEGAPVLTYENLLHRVQKEREDWGAHNFPNAGALQHALGVCEEAGELAHAVLKMEPGTAENTSIRGDQEDLLDKAADALGDLIIYACGVASDLGLSLSDCLAAAWDEVKQRDWVKYPTNGKDH